MADGPDERLVAGLRHLVGDLVGGEKFGLPREAHYESVLKERMCLLCDRCWGCHSGWVCPTEKDLREWERGECEEGCRKFRKKNEGETA